MRPALRGGVDLGLAEVGAGGIQHAGDERHVGLVAAPQHDGGVAVVQAHEGARRAQAHGAHQHQADFVALVDLLADQGAHGIGGAAPGARLARADHGGVAVDGAENARQAVHRRQLGQRRCRRQPAVVLADHVEPEVVGDVQVLEHVLALARVVGDCLLLRRGGGFALHRQFVLHLRHADVHGERRAHQGVAFVVGQAEFARHDVAQRAADQRVRGAVAHRGRGGELEHQVQRSVDVVRHQFLQPAVELAQLGGEIAHLAGTREQHRQGRFEVAPEAEQILVFLVVRVARERLGGHGGVF